MIQRVPLAPAGASPGVRAVIWGVPILLVGTAFLSGPDARSTEWPLVILGVLLAVVFFLAPRRLAYALAPDALVVSRLTGRTALPYAGMRARRTAGRLGVRLLGTGLPGYLTGQFSFGPDGPGRVRAAASRGTGGVIVESGGQPHFLTPADPDAFLRALERRGAVVTG